jgi:hypothetical protein
MDRRRGCSVTDLLSNTIEDIKDSIDDEVVDRAAAPRSNLDRSTSQPPGLSTTEDPEASR